MPNLSRIIIEGHAGRDAEIKQFGDKQVTSFSMAVTHKYKENTTTNWFDVSVWGKPADWAKLIRKGDAVHVDGTFKMEEYEKKDGSKGIALRVTASEFHKIAKLGQADGETVGAEDIPF